MKINKGIKKVKRFMAISLSVLCLSSCANVSLADGSLARVSKMIGVEIAHNKSFKRLADNEIYEFNESFSQENFRMEIINVLYSILARVKNSELGVLGFYADSRINYMLDNLPSLGRGPALIGIISSFVINLLNLVHKHDPAAARKNEILEHVRRIEDIEDQNINFNNIKIILTNMLNSMEQFFADHLRPNAV